MLTALTKARWDPMTGRAAKDDCGAPVVVSYQSSNGTAPKPPEAYLTTEEMRRSRVAVSVTKAAVHISHPGHCMTVASEQASMEKVHEGYYAPDNVYGCLYSGVNKLGKRYDCILPTEYQEALRSLWPRSYTIASLHRSIRGIRGNLGV